MRLKSEPNKKGTLTAIKQTHISNTSNIRFWVYTTPSALTKGIEPTNVAFFMLQTNTYDDGL